MKKKLLAMATAALLALSVMGIAACSSSSSGSASSASSSSASASASASSASASASAASESSSAASESASASAASESASAASASTSAAAAQGENPFVGKWTMVAIEMKGMTVYGDLTQVNGPEEFTVELTADGKAMFAASGDTTEGTWTAVDATTASLTDDAGDVYAIDYDTQNDTISLEFEGVKLIFASENGKANFTAYSFDEAKPITDANQYVGTWTLSAFGADGMYATGDITAMLGGTLSIEIKDDGTAVFAFGTENVDATYEVTDGKLILTANGTSMELRDFEGSLAMDFSESYGAEGAVLILSK